jgi:aryl carrier-like protein
LIERIRAELSRVIDEPIEDCAVDENLVGRGLHSLAIMHLLEPLSRLAGKRLAYADLARNPSLHAWLLLCERESTAINNPSSGQ